MSCTNAGVKVVLYPPAAIIERKGTVKNKKSRRKEKVEKTPTEEITLSLINQGKNLQEIADERSLVLSTIYTHLAKLIHAKKIDIAQYVDIDLLDRVMLVLNETPEISNSELFERLEGSVTYDELRLIRAHQLSSNNQSVDH